MKSLHAPAATTMGGEWIFTFESEGKAKRYSKDNKFDLRMYQDLLRQFRQDHSASFKDGEATWASEQEAAETNIYAQFQYDCDRHHRHHRHHWSLLWDPNKVTRHVSHVHARCAPEPFKSASSSMQEALEKAFPSFFDLYWGDGYSGFGTYEELIGNEYDERDEEFTPEDGWYHTGDGERVWACRGEQPDFTACSSECGYCGRCQY